MGSPGCQKQSDCAGYDPEQKAFRQQLADHASAAGAERRAHCKLAPASSGAREQQARDIDAGKQQDEAHRGKQYEKEWPHIADDLLLQRNDACADAFVRVGKGGGKVARDLRPCRPEPAPA